MASFYACSSDNGANENEHTVPLPIPLHSLEKRSFFTTESLAIIPVPNPQIIPVPKSQAVRISNQLVVQKLSAVLLRTMHHRIPSHQAAPQKCLLTQTFSGQTNSMAPPSTPPIGVLKLATAAGATTNGNTTPTVQKTPTSKTEFCIFARSRKTSKQQATRRPA